MEHQLEQCLFLWGVVGGGNTWSFASLYKKQQPLILLLMFLAKYEYHMTAKRLS